MDGSKKKAGKKTRPHKSKILDNALLHESSKPAAKNLLFPAAEARVGVQVAEDREAEIKRETSLSSKKDKKTLEKDGSDYNNSKKARRASRPVEPDIDEKTDVFKIIADLEKQLDAAFSLKDIQEKEIQDLKEGLEEAEEKAAALDEELKETKGKLVSQRKLELELESFENEQFAMLSEKKSLKEELQAGSSVKKDLEDKIAVLAKEAEDWNARIGQMELEISNANTAVQNLRHEIFVLEDEKDVLSRKIEATEAELSGVTTERDRYKKELSEAKDSLDEIRLTLVDTRTRARGRYYKNKSK